MNIIQQIQKNNREHSKEVFRKLLPVVDSSCKTCKATDPGCCYQKAIVPVHEALVIADHLVETKRDSTELREKLARDGRAMSEATRREWFDSKTPCAFLVDGKCSVYAVRPFACSSYFVVSDPAKCHPNSEDNKVAIINAQLAIAHHLMHSREIHRDVLGLRETEFRIMVGALPRLVLMMLEGMMLDEHEWRDYVRNQKWHTITDIDNEWRIQL